MLPIGWFVLAVVVAVVLSIWVTFTLTRLDRLHARVDAAQAALDAQLVRRAAALARLAAGATDATGMSDATGVDGAVGAAGADRASGGLAPDVRMRLEAAAQLALDRGVADQAGETGPGGEREAAENAVGREVAQLSAGEMSPASIELREAATRVLIARRFYNDAVRDTRSLRARRVPRVLHLAGHRALPEFFDIDDTLPAPSNAAPSNAVPREQDQA